MSVGYPTTLDTDLSLAGASAVVSTTVAVTVEPADTSITLTSASSFGTSGTAEVGQETFTWTGKTSNNLTGVTRGVIGRAHRHQAGDKVSTIASQDTFSSGSKDAAKAIQGELGTLPKGSFADVSTRLKRNEQAVISAVKTTTYPVLATDATILCDSSSAGFAVNLPTAAVAGVGKIYRVVRINTGSSKDVSVTPSGAETINGVNAAVALTVQWDYIVLQAITGGWLRVGGVVTP